MTEDLINAAANSMFSPNGPIVNPTQAQQQQISHIQSRSTGGPAFPVASYQGLTMRDYFAAKALQGSVASGLRIDESLRARWAYEMADAMLEARNK